MASQVLRVRPGEGPPIETSLAYVPPLAGPALGKSDKADQSAQSLRALALCGELPAVK